MIAYQPVDPASGLLATRLDLAQLTGHFLCRRVRSSFSNAALIELMAEFRAVACACGTRFDVQVLTAEKVAVDAANLTRSGRCPLCRATHDSHLQFRRDGLILSRESDGWYIWLSRVHPNQHGNVMEEHLFWHQVDWARRDAELAEEFNVPDEAVSAWRRRVGKPRSRAKPALQPRRSRTAQADSPGL